MTARAAPRTRESRPALRIVHLFPDLLRVYGDTGNVQTLAVRARRRGIDALVRPVLADAADVPEADLFVIGGGQDRDQAAVERSLARLGDRIARQIDDGAALLAVCAGYQSLGISYRDSRGRVMHGPGILRVRTEARAGRLVGPVIAHATLPLFDGPRTTIVGFENHSGRTILEPDATPLATVEVGHGNQDHDGTEGVVELPAASSLRGLRLGTYLHGPLLPRNPHVADALLRAALLRSGQVATLRPLDDAAEWRAHDRHVERSRHRSWADRLPSRLRRAIDPARNLVGF
jgi:CobQ-like glutamine amidotransferase family enzyme